MEKDKRVMKLRTKLLDVGSDEAYSDSIQVSVRSDTKARAKKFKEAPNGLIIQLELNQIHGGLLNESYMIFIPLNA